jgi:hypothetical protein
MLRSTPDAYPFASPRVKISSLVTRVGFQVPAGTHCADASVGPLCRLAVWTRLCCFAGHRLIGVGQNEDVRSFAVAIVWQAFIGLAGAIHAFRVGQP